MKLEIRDKAHAAILEKAFNDRAIVEFHGVSLAINERGYNFDGRSSWTFGFQEVHKAKWNGKGLPPVGTVCEWHPNHDGWVKVEILGHSGEETWFRRDGHESSETCLRMAFFRPIRTPEQIAAEEREKAIEEMVHDHDNDQLRAWAAYVYDILGYRK